MVARSLLIKHESNASKKSVIDVNIDNRKWPEYVIIMFRVRVSHDKNENTQRGDAIPLQIK